MMIKLNSLILTSLITLAALSARAESIVGADQARAAVKARETYEHSIKGASSQSCKALKAAIAKKLIALNDQGQREVDSICELMSSGASQSLDGLVQALSATKHLLSDLKALYDLAPEYQHIDMVSAPIDPLNNLKSALANQVDDLKQRSASH